MAELTIINARSKTDIFINSITPYVNKFEGRGIVICGGGVRLYTNAWVCINMLRYLGCILPIELWYLGPKEMDTAMIELLKPLGVRCVDALEVKKRIPARILMGWELKAYALLNCRFEEVLLLDADNVPVLNPEYLFENEQYRATGAIFWPDIGRLQANRAIWRICSVPYNDEPEFESGQIIVNKELCWKALKLAMWYNEHSDFYYRHIHGDKETFHMAFRRLGKQYTMVPKPVILQNRVMYQHDLEGKLVFQHRNGYKWSYDGDNPDIEGFLYQKECLGFVEELRVVWPGYVISDFTDRCDKERRAIQLLLAQQYNYKRIGYDERLMSFLPNGRIGEGKADMEIMWNVFSKNETNVFLEIMDEKQPTCILSFGPDAVWRGRWLKFEKMFVDLSPVAKS